MRALFDLSRCGGLADSHEHGRNRTVLVWITLVHDDIKLGWLYALLVVDRYEPANGHATSNHADVLRESHAQHGIVALLGEFHASNAPLGLRSASVSMRVIALVLVAYHAPIAAALTTNLSTTLKRTKKQKRTQMVGQGKRL